MDARLDTASDREQVVVTAFAADPAFACFLLGPRGVPEQAGVSPSVRACSPSPQL
jgi:hypothetical protein